VTLHKQFEKYANPDDVVVLGIPRGGVPVAVEVARALRAPLDVFSSPAQQELMRCETVYRADEPPVSVAGKTAILVDDGIATGASLLACIRALRQLRPAKIVVAVPVAPAPVCKRLADEVDEMVCVATPEPFGAVGQFYDHFSQVDDEEVVGLLARNQWAESATAT